MTGADRAPTRRLAAEAVDIDLSRAKRARPGGLEVDGRSRSPTSPIPEYRSAKPRPKAGRAYIALAGVAQQVSPAGVGVEHRVLAHAQERPHLAAQLVA